MRVPYALVRSSRFHFSPKYLGWLYVPSEWHITTWWYFFAPERKIAFKLKNLATIAISKFLISFKFHISLKKYTFLVGWLHVQSAVHVTTTLIYSAEWTISTKIFSNKKNHIFSLETVGAICFGSLLELSFFSKICRMVICPVRVTYNHVVIFFAMF